MFKEECRSVGERMETVGYRYFVVRFVCGILKQEILRINIVYVWISLNLISVA